MKPTTPRHWWCCVCLVSFSQGKASPSLTGLVLQEEALVITNGLGHVISKHLMVGYKGSKKAQYQATSGEWGSRRCCSGDD